MNSVLHELLIVTSIRTLVANMRFYYKDIAACILIILAVNECEVSSELATRN